MGQASEWQTQLKSASSGPDPLSKKELFLIRAFGQKNSTGHFIRKFVLGGVVTSILVGALIRGCELYFDLDPTYGMILFALYAVAGVLVLGVMTARSLERLELQEVKMGLKQHEVNTAHETGKLRDKFLANMSHEVRTPLTAIMGYLDFVEEPIMDIHERLEFIRRAKHSAKSLLRVLDDILDLSKIAGDHLRLRLNSFALQEFIPDLISQFYLEAKSKGLVIESHVDESMPPAILADPNRLQQILTHLLSNAVKFTDHGRIDIHVSYEKSEVPNEGILSIDVKDTGPGIPADVQDKLFRSFYQVDDSITRRHGGSGIGLSLAQNLAALMQGQLRLTYSELNKGSTFNLRFPCQALRGGVVQMQIPTDFSTANGLNGVNVLLIEDSIDNQFLVRRYLSKEGAQVDVAENGKIGVDKAMERIYSVILMDIQMPVMSGLEATRLLRQKGYQGLIIALSAHASEEHQHRSLAAGCDAHLSKPIDRNELVRSIQFMLQDLDATL